MTTAMRTVEAGGVAAAALLRRVDPGIVAGALVRQGNAERPASARGRGALVQHVTGVLRLATRMAGGQVATRASLRNEVSSLLDLPRTAVAAGMSLDALLRGYYIGTQLVLAALTRLSRPEEAHPLVSATHAVVKVGHLMAAAVPDLYTVGADPFDRAETRARALLNRVTEWATAADQVRNDAAALGVELTDRVTVFAADVCSAARRLRLARQLRTAGALAAAMDGQVLGVFSGGQPEFARLEPQALVALTGSASLGGVGAAIADARLALAAARGHDRKPGVLRVDEYLIEVCLGRDASLTARIRDRAARGLGREPELWQTLRVLLDMDLDRRRAADRLHVHRNTLVYRLRRIETLTGRRMDRVRDLVLLYLASRSAPPSENS